MTVWGRATSVGVGGLLLVIAWFLFFRRRRVQETLEYFWAPPGPSWVFDAVASLGAFLLALGGSMSALSGILG